MYEEFVNAHNIQKWLAVSTKLLTANTNNFI
ncbi:hypothetical protein SAMN04488505_111229 [Chitinophaga rupis]|uniref:Uncharacterized protein n=1 Tax=Chitinophaga rupis TaxID=573321 RepID=A0A1H8I2C1_9BACT|nr:hypothetical protein SAMN04488505_111229 [Chitinophaga rupis]